MIFVQEAQMKHWFVLVLAVALSSCGDGNINPKPNPTVPDGEMNIRLPSSTSTIGSLIADASGSNEWVASQGGTVVSSDGLLRVVAPNGALPNGSWVDIRPVNSSAPNFLGATYRVQIGAISTSNLGAPLLLEFTPPSDSSSSDFLVLRHSDTGEWQAMPSSQLQLSNSPNPQRVRVGMLW
jgi:hypothetical protein